jgi:uncharacterized protein with ParB-like and HNH nuclease domain
MINPTGATIGSLLSSYQFEVPRFQRGYEWRETHATEFWEDLEGYIDARSGGPFIGTFIFMPSKEDQKRLTIIDGQQRITTILLFLIACRNVAKEIDRPELAHEIQRNITFIDPATAKSRGSRLLASETVKDTFDRIADADWSGKFTENNRRQVGKLKPVYDYFHGQIHRNRTDLSALLRAILETHAVKIEIENEMEAFDVFERTNARGVELEVADLLKNYLFKREVRELDEKWDTIISNADGNSFRMLKYFFVAYKGPVRKPELFKQLKRYETETSAEEFTNELVDFSTFYKKIRSGNCEAFKETLQSLGIEMVARDQEKLYAVYAAVEALRLFKIFQAYPLIYSALKSYSRASESKKRSRLVVELFEALERYHFINNSICERIGNQVEKLYADFCLSYAKTENNFEDVTPALIEALKSQLAPKDEFVARFSKLTYEAREIPRLMYVFDRLNNFDLPASQRLRIFYPEDMRRRNWNVEHFFPRKPETAVEKITAVDNIGNLLPLDFRTNSALNNKSPLRKIEWLKKPGNQKKVENISYLRGFLEDYDEKVSDWGDGIIEARARGMAADAYDKVWKI